jgi:mitochondrial fission protein ELM1
MKQFLTLIFVHQNFKAKPKTIKKCFVKKKMSDSENVYRRQRVGLIFGVNFGQKKFSSEKCEEEDQIKIVKVLSKQSWNFFADFDGKKWKWNEVTSFKNPIFIILSLILNNS